MNKSASVYMLSCLLVGHTQANGWQTNNIHGPSQVNIVDSIPVDLNNDGLMDVVSVSIEDGQVRAYHNQGNFNFTEEVLATDVAGGLRLSAVDLNGDEKLDFLIPSIETNEIIALYYHPDGYVKKVIVENILLPTDAQAADFTGDGVMDVVSTSFQDNSVYLHEQNTAGEFLTKLLSDKVQQPRAIVTEDFNQDQRPDLLVASSADNSVRLFINHQSTFKVSLVSDQLTGVRSIAACDVNGDEWIDFVAAATATDQVEVFTNNGSEAFSSKTLDVGFAGPTKLFCADTDGDQDDELITISSAVGNITTAELNGAVDLQLIANTRDGYVSLNFAYFEQGAEPRIMTQSFFENRNLLYVPTQANVEQVVWEDFPDGSYYVDVADLDQDGDEDIVYAAFREDKIYLAEQTETGHNIHVVYAGIDGPQGVALGDIDSDGDVDIVSAGAWDDTFWLHENTGNLSFQTTPLFEQANNAARLVITDLNGDGKQDIIGTSSLDDSVRWFEQTISGYQMRLIDDNADGALALTAADIDNDDDQDLIVGNFFSNSITTYINSGNNQFVKTEVSSNKTKPTSVLAQDLDGDDDVDLVYNSSVLNSIWLNENQVSMFENERLISDDIQDVQDFTAADFTNDGMPDLVAVASQETEVVGLINDQLNDYLTTSLVFDAFGARSIQSQTPTSDHLIQFVTASNIDNSVKQTGIIDLIYNDGFE